jgi:hypothetical protein
MTETVAQTAPDAIQCRATDGEQSMLEAINRFAERFGALMTDQSIDDSTRTSRGVDLAWEAVARLQDDANALMTGLVRHDRWVFGALATAIEKTHAGSGRDADAREEPAHAPLFLVPVVFIHKPGATVPRRLGLDLPPLPDGRPVPGLVDFLLSWEELTQRFSATLSLRDTLAKVCEGMSAQDAQAALEKVFGAAASRSAMDEYDSEQGRSYSLRFLPAYCLPDDAPWFATFAERTEWQERAHKAIQLASLTDMFPYPQAPAPYAIALAIAESFVIDSAIRLVVEDATRAAGAAGATGKIAMALLFEPFGAPETSVASHFRISAIPPGKVAQPYASVSIRLPMARQWAFWEDAAAKAANTARERFGIESTVAGFVQELDLLFPELGETRLHVTLGPPLGSTPPTPDGLPFEFPRNPGELRQLSDFERGQAPGNLAGFGEALAAKLQLESPPQGGRIAYALLQGVWRPVMTIPLGGCRTMAGKRLHRPLDKVAVEGAWASWSARAARAWSTVTEAGGSNG